MKTVYLFLAATALTIPGRAGAGEDNKILDAVKQLDVGNDNHWTADGLPRLETVKMLVSDPDLTVNRDAVEAAAPGFTRTTAPTYGQSAPPPPPPPPPPPAPDVSQDTSAPQPGLQSDASVGNGAGPAGTGSQPDVVVNQEQRDALTPVTAPSADSLRGTDNNTLRAQASTPGPNNMNAEGGPSDGPSVPDEVQAAAALPAPQVGLPPEITQGATMRGANLLATPESDLYDSAISTARSPTTPWGLGGSREGGVPAGQSAEDPTSPEQGVTAAAEPTGKAQLHTMEHGVAGDPDAIEGLESQLAEAEKASAALKAQADDVNGQLAAAVAREVALRGAIEAARPRDGLMPSIQSYFASSNKVEEDRAAARQVLKDGGLDLNKVKSIFGEQ